MLLVPAPQNLIIDAYPKSYYVHQRNKKTRLRLDCAIDNVRLNHYYENKGYVFAGQCLDGSYVGNKREKRLGWQITNLSSASVEQV
jgi:hypothetical protein